MVCLRCQIVVKNELEKLGLICTTVDIGWAEIEGPVNDEQMTKIKIALLNAGLELISDKKNILIEKIKKVISDMIDFSEEQLKTNFSYHLSRELSHDYTYLANIFSATQGSTIEHYIIMNRIRKVKELICHSELTLTEISWKLHYSSVAHLSTQFKKVTGVTPSHFKYIDCHSSTSPEMCEL